MKNFENDASHLNVSKFKINNYVDYYKYYALVQGLLLDEQKRHLRTQLRFFFLKLLETPEENSQFSWIFWGLKNLIETFNLRHPGVFGSTGYGFARRVQHSYENYQRPL